VNFILGVVVVVKIMEEEEEEPTRSGWRGRARRVLR
jgi:hypothetical protein